MDYLFAYFSVFFAFATLFTKKPVLSSVFYFFTVLNISAIFFTQGLTLLSLILLFSSSFFLIVCFLFSPILLQKKPHALPSKIMGGLFALVFLIIVFIRFKFFQTNLLVKLKPNSDELIKNSVIQNFPVLITFLLILITTLLFVLSIRRILKRKTIL